VEESVMGLNALERQQEVAAGRPRGGGFGIALALIAGTALVYLAAMMLALRVLLLPAEESGRLFVLFPPGTSQSAAFSAIVAAGGEPIRPVVGSFGWAAHGVAEGFVGRLGGQGALAAFREAPAGLPLLGCFGMIGDQSDRTPPLIRPI
jgi:hypothetical protein